MKYRKMIAGLSYKMRKNKNLKNVHVSWLGKEYSVWPGTIRNEVDYDDCWFQVLSYNSKNIIDIGANVGYTALLALSFSSNKKILLIDPNPDALGIAATNLFRNSYSKQSEFYCAFVSSIDDKREKFYTVGSGAAGSKYSEHVLTAKYANSWYYVNTKKIDSILEETSFVPDLVKVDVEGAELEVLKGAEFCAGHYSPIFFVEMHSNTSLSMEDNATGVISWCKKQNYRAWYMKEHIELTKPDKIAHRGKCHLLLIPKEREYPEFLKDINQASPLFESEDILRQKSL